MSHWRLWATLPQAKSSEEMRAQSIDGWNPWEHNWSNLGGSQIVIFDREVRSVRPRLYEVWRGDHYLKFAATEAKDVWRFYVPTTPDAVDALEAITARYEGHWRGHADEKSSSPWPKSEPHWSSREAFLDALDRLETGAEKITYRGIAKCRLCGCANGHEAFQSDEWEWPAGFRHYLTVHEVRPTIDFEAFVYARGRH